MREWITLAGAVAIGPAFLLIGYRIPGLVFGATTIANALLCAVVVPLLTVAAGRFKFLAWQTAVISITLAVVGDNVRLNAIQRNEILSVAYVFWAAGTLLSSPFPIYLLLKPLAPRQRYIAFVLIGLIALALWLGIKKVTG